MTPQKLLANKALCPKHENGLSGKALNPSMHKLLCMSSLAVTFKGAVDYACMQSFN